MGYIVRRVSGLDSNGKRVIRRFSDDKEGREGAERLISSLKDVRTYYDARVRVGGRVVNKSSRTKRAAEAWVTTQEAGKLRGITMDPRRGRVTLCDYANSWLADRHDLGERTAELYRWVLDRYIVPTFGGSQLGQVTTESVRRWNAALAQKHPATAAKAYRLLSAIMRTAVADEVIVRSPCVVKGAATERSAERPVATVSEVQALADAMSENLALAVRLAAWCQLRRGELLGLRRRDIDLLDGTLDVIVTRTVGMDGRIIQKEPKTDAGRRTVAIPSNVLPYVEKHLGLIGTEPDAFLFDVLPRTLDRAWERARASVGRTDLHLHDLRHSGLTWSAASGATVAELMHRAGHKDSRTALRYQHATRDRDKALAEALAALAAPTAGKAP